MNLRDLVAAAVGGFGHAEVRDPRQPVTRPPANPELDLLALTFGIERLDTIVGC